MLFNNYSFNNQILINIQREDATYVSSFKNYTKLGYKINKGAKGIKVLIPNFVTMVKIKSNENIEEIKPYYLLNKAEKEKYKDKQDNSVSVYKQKLTGFSLGNVFDIKDTNMPADAIEHELNLVLDDTKASEIMNCFIKTIYNDNYKVRFEEMHDTKKGYCDYENQEIVIRKGMGSLVQMKVLIHEYAHALAHTHLKNNNQEYQQHRSQYETEAESIAYVVSKYLGMPTIDYSLSYLYSWSKEKDFKEIDDSLNTIVNYSKRIINNYEKFYDREYGLYANDLGSVKI